MCHFKRLDFLLYRNAEEEVQESIFQSVIWGIRDLTKISGGFWHPASSLSLTCSLCTRSAPCSQTSIWAREELKYDRWDNQEAQWSFYFRAAAWYLEQLTEVSTVYFNHFHCAHLDLALGKILTKTTILNQFKTVYCDRKAPWNSVKAHTEKQFPLLGKSVNINSLAWLIPPCK